jgi:transcriptional regulator with XRE-family HTH domain
VEYDLFIDQKMSKPIKRTISRYSCDALLLLSQMIRRGRIERRLTTQALADRAGISRGLLQRIEKGDPGCAIGAAFEVAAIVGIPLFDSDRRALAASISANNSIVALLPKSVRPWEKKLKDDF